MAHAYHTTNSTSNSKWTESRVSKKDLSTWVFSCRERQALKEPIPKPFRALKVRANTLNWNQPMNMVQFGSYMLWESPVNTPVFPMSNKLEIQALFQGNSCNSCSSNWYCTCISTGKINHSWAAIIFPTAFSGMGTRSGLEKQGYLRDSTNFMWMFESMKYKGQNRNLCWNKGHILSIPNCACDWLVKEWRRGGGRSREGNYNSLNTL